MNFRFVLGQLGLLILVLSFCMGVVTVLELVLYMLQQESDFIAVQAMGLSTLIGAIFGVAFWMGGVRNPELLQRREALMLTASTWLLGGIIAALPFWFWAIFGGPPEIAATTVPTFNDPEVSHTVAAGHEFTSFASCYFEAISGLTTTGATVLGERGTIEELPKGLLLWRSITHWLGGLGIVVLFVAVLPSLGVGAKKLFQTESSSQEAGVRPRIRETARMLWLIYFSMTVVAIFLFHLLGMTWFDAINHGFSVLATGGYSTHDASMGHYDSWALDMITCLFMLVAGINFAVLYRLVRGRWKSAIEDVELRWYLALKVVGTLVIMLNLMGGTITTTAGNVITATFFEALRFASFQTISMQTGTGFCSADYDLWPYLSQAFLIGLVVAGGCAGSTAGGIKVIRLVICMKVFSRALERAFRPNVVRPIKLGGSTVDEELKLSAVTYVLLFIVLFALGMFLLFLFEPGDGRCDLATGITAAGSSICNVGPGLHETGATKNFGWFTAPSKIVLSLLMVLGRLEIYALFVLFTPRFWRSD